MGVWDTAKLWLNTASHVEPGVFNSFDTFTHNITLAKNPLTTKQCLIELGCNSSKRFVSETEQLDFIVLAAASNIPITGVQAKTREVFSNDQIYRGLSCQEAVARVLVSGCEMTEPLTYLALIS